MFTLRAVLLQRLVMVNSTVGQGIAGTTENRPNACAAPDFKKHRISLANVNMQTFLYETRALDRNILQNMSGMIIGCLLCLPCHITP